MTNIKTIFEQFDKSITKEIERLAYSSYQLGYEAAVNVVDELSNQAWNEGQRDKAELFRWLAKELKGENDEA